jgi:hypothetical protein
MPSNLAILGFGAGLLAGRSTMGCYINSLTFKGRISETVLSSNHGLLHK